MTLLGRRRVTTQVDFAKLEGEELGGERAAEAGDSRWMIETPSHH